MILWQHAWAAVQNVCLNVWLVKPVFSPLFSKFWLTLCWDSDRAHKQLVNRSLTPFYDTRKLITVDKGDHHWDLLEPQKSCTYLPALSKWLILILFPIWDDCTFHLLSYVQFFSYMLLALLILSYLLTPWSRILLEKLTGFAANQQIPSILWNPKVHYRTHKCPSLSCLTGFNHNNVIRKDRRDWDDEEDVSSCWITLRTQEERGSTRSHTLEDSIRTRHHDYVTMTMMIFDEKGKFWTVRSCPAGQNVYCRRPF